MKNLLYFFLITLLVLSCSRCKEEDCTDSTNPDCPNYVAPVDPCAGKTEVSADFVIEERISIIGDGEFISTDTTLKERNIRFRAITEGAVEYKWYIGNEIINQQIVTRFFSSQWTGSNIPITLVVRKIPDTACFPNDDGYDSITKVFHISDYPILPNPLGDPNREVQHGGLQGTYRLAREGIQDSVDVHIAFCDNYVGIQVVIENLDGMGSNCICDTKSSPGGPRIQAWSYRYAEFGQSTPNTIGLDFCSSLQGKLERKLNGDVFLDVQSLLLPTPTSPVSDVVSTFYHYKGRKIN